MASATATGLEYTSPVTQPLSVTEQQHELEWANELPCWVLVCARYQSDSAIATRCVHA